MWQLDTSLLTIWRRQGNKSLVLPGGKLRRKPKPGESILQRLSLLDEVWVWTVSLPTCHGQSFDIMPEGRVCSQAPHSHKPYGSNSTCACSHATPMILLAHPWAEEGLWTTRPIGSGQRWHNCFHTRIRSATGITSRGALSGAGLRQHENEF